MARHNPLYKPPESIFGGVFTLWTPEQGKGTGAMLTAGGKERQDIGLFERPFCSKHVGRLGSLVAHGRNLYNIPWKVFPNWGIGTVFTSGWAIDVYCLPFLFYLCTRRPRVVRDAEKGRHSTSSNGRSRQGSSQRTSLPSLPPGVTKHISHQARNGLR